MTDVTTQPISDLFEGGGIALQPASDRDRSFDGLERDEIIRLFERHGVVLFRGFDLRPEDLTAATDRFTEAYSPDLATRAHRFGQPALRDVDKGSDEIGLHVEAGFASLSPEIIWFYCNTPSTTGGTTTLCDGIRLWQALGKDVQRSFLAQPVRYQFSFGFGEKKPGQGRAPWPMPTIGSDGYVDRDEGTATLSVLRYAVHEARLKGKPLCFANFLLPKSGMLTRTMADGSAIADDTMALIRAAAEATTFDHEWQAQDLVMVDNRRFMHGRRAFDATRDARDIMQIQTSSASFAYGATIRQARSPQPAQPAVAGALAS
jgi:alpha-ketoglutarate-dependent taurine dioxygenase